MKNRNKLACLALLLLLMIFGYNIQGQVPHMFTYQAVVRDGNGALLTNRVVGVRICITQNDDTELYCERHAVMTNSNGLFSLMVGAGLSEFGIMDSLDWSTGLRFIKSEIDIDGGEDYVTIGVQQLVSVPYALHAITADRLSSDSSGTHRTDTVHYYVYEW